MKRSLVVKKSRIHGKGVFAARDFKKGEVVIKWDTSNKLTKDEVKKLSEREKNYVSYSDGKYVYMQIPERFVNHSCDANTTCKDFCDIAIRDIKKGEEITSDYSKDLLPNFEMLCKCGSKDCKKMITRK